jgi:hypothetical protein
MMLLLLLSRHGTLLDIDAVKRGNVTQPCVRCAIHQKSNFLFKVTRRLHKYRLRNRILRFGMKNVMFFKGHSPDSSRR